MEHKKRWIIFGILMMLLINILFVTALGSGASFGGSINIPLGNQSFPNITSPVNNITNNTTNQTTSHDNTQTNANNNSSTSSANSNTSTQSSTASSSSTNKNIQKSVGNLIKPFINTQNNKNESLSSSKNQNSESSQNIIGFQTQEVKIVLIINTLCLFFAFVVLRDYTKSLEDEI